MHKYLRAIGFANIKEKKDIEFFLNRAVSKQFLAAKYENGDGTYMEQYEFIVAPGMGITLVGERDENGDFHREYYFPYVRSYDGIITYDTSVERHIEKETYSGVVDDFGNGIALIFYLCNSMKYRRLVKEYKKNPEARQVFLTGLALEGKIILPLEKFEEDEEISRKIKRKEEKLYKAAKAGDEEAIKSLTRTDLDLMSSISKRIENEDLYTLVESSFMPIGIECDQYQILGEILGIRIKTNVYSEEKVVDLKLNCNDSIFHVCINESDLQGVPTIGRRFKGVVWMQGEMEFMENSIDSKELIEDDCDDYIDAMDDEISELREFDENEDDDISSEDFSNE